MQPNSLTAFYDSTQQEGGNVIDMLVRANGVLGLYLPG